MNHQRRRWGVGCLTFQARIRENISWEWNEVWGRLVDQTLYFPLVSISPWGSVSCFASVSAGLAVLLQKSIFKLLHFIAIKCYFLSSLSDPPLSPLFLSCSPLPFPPHPPFSPKTIHVNSLSNSVLKKEKKKKEKKTTASPLL